MAIIGFNFTQVIAEREKPATGKIEINTNITILDLAEQDLNLKEGKQKAIKFVFQFSTNYSPDIGRIVIKGEVVNLFDAKTADEVLKEFKKDKKVKKEILPGLYSFVLGKCHVEAIAISRDVSLPPPLPMPRVKAKETEAQEDYIG